MYGLCDLLALRETGSESKIFDPRVRAGTDEYLVDSNIRNRHIG